MKTLPLPNNAQAVIKPTFTDQFGLPASAPSSIGTATSSDTTLFSASVNSDGNVVVIGVPGAVGTGTLNYANGGLTDSGDVTVAAPEAEAVSLDSADAVITAQTTTAPAASTVSAPITTVDPTTGAATVAPVVTPAT